MPTRRTAMLLPLLLAACGRDRPPPLAPLGWTHLLRLNLDVAELEFDPTDPPAPPNDIGRQLVVRPAEVVRMMGRDRLGTTGTGGIAVFSVMRAQIVPDRGGLACILACRLEVAKDNVGRGFVEAEARAAVTDAGSGRDRIDAAERLLRQAMDRLNVELEFQLRSRLRDWIAAPPGAAPPPPPVETEELPRG